MRHELLLLVLIPCVVAPSTVSAMSMDLSTEVVSDYVWRGQLQYLDRGRPAVQTDLAVEGNVGPGALGLDLWLSLAATHWSEIRDEIGNHVELDTTVSYSVDLVADTLSYSTGLVSYAYPASGGPIIGTEEVFMALGSEGRAGEADLTLFWDLHEARGVYLQVHWGLPVDLGALTVGPHVTLGGGRYTMIQKDAWLDDLTCELRAEYSPASGDWWVSARAAWTLGDPLGADSAPLDERQIPWAGLGVGGSL